MKCVILGGAGFIGGHLAEALVAAGHSVRLFDRPGSTPPGALANCAQVEQFDGDFLNQEDLVRPLQGCDVVFHLVSTTLPGNSNASPRYDVESNVLGTLGLLELLKDKPIRKLIFVSSGGTVYGNPEQVPIPETHPTNPITAHGIGKLMIEKYLALYHSLHGLDYCILRMSNPYGERQRVNAPQGAVAVFLGRALRDEAIDVWGDGTVTRDFVYIGDAVAALVGAMRYDGPIRLFNVGSGSGLSLNDLFAEIERALGRPVKRNYLPGRKFDVRVNVLDIGRIKRAFAWHPEVPFPEGLRRTLSWLQRASAK